MGLNIYTIPESPGHGLKESETHALGKAAPLDLAPGFKIANNYGSGANYGEQHYSDSWYVTAGSQDLNLTIVNETTWNIMIEFTYSEEDFPYFSYDVNGNVNGIWCGMNPHGGGFIQSILSIGQYTDGSPIKGTVSWHPWFPLPQNITTNPPFGVYSDNMGPAVAAVYVDQEAGEIAFDSSLIGNYAMLFWIGIMPDQIPAGNFSASAKGLVCLSASVVSWP